MRTKSVVDNGQAARVNGRRPQNARRDAVHWARIIEVQRQSRLTVVEFCRRRRIAKATFWYWRKRLATTEKRELVARPEQRFLAVPLVTPAAEHIEVDLGTMRVRLDGAGVARVVDAIVDRVGCGVQR